MKYSNIKNFIFTFLVGISFFFSCKPIVYEEPKISLDTYQITDGFEMEVIASEPFLEAPVTMDFDNQGRMWVIEMKGYMRNLEGIGEELPNGTISIMEDLDQDGITDHSKIFMDGLVLPRAIAHVYGGLLYAEPPNLWFVEIVNDKPLNKILVDSLYSDGGNVEHQPNGLMMSIDNWIYNVKSNFRYQRKNGEWIKEATSFRGQWGISRDDFGRLLYNNNSVQLIGDYILPNTFIRNPYFTPKVGVNNRLTNNQRVYPLHAASVNRGYQKGTLDKDSLLINVTSSCGPLVYRGDQFPADYYQNAFVCVPEANLIKRNILSFNGDNISADQAWDGKEFMASTDEGFRPVNLFNGPGGAMYVVDMHRGIIQHKAFLSPYLQKQLAAKKLDTILGMGRILRVKNKDNDLSKTPELENISIEELVSLLKNKNGWIRDKAQQLLVLKKDRSAIPFLTDLAFNKDLPVSQVHALYSLHGMDALSFDILNKVLKSNNSMTIAHVLLLTENFVGDKNNGVMLQQAKKLMLKTDPVIDLYLCTSIGPWRYQSNELFFPLLSELSNKYSDNKIYQEGILSSLNGDEQNFKDYLVKEGTLSESIIIKMLDRAIVNRQRNRKNNIFVKTTVTTDSRTAGHKIFRDLCSTCHGFSGEGIEGLAPPLQGSEYAKGSSVRLAKIILHGLEGPIHVNGKLYKFNTVMPGLANNKDFSDEDIANIISYMHNAFASDSKNISKGEIKSLRDQKPIKGALFTEEELLEFK